MSFPLWEYIDTDTGGSNNGYNDVVDVTLEQLYDGILRWQADDPTPGIPHENRSNDEFYLTSAGKVCTSGRNEQCDPGDVCEAYACKTGDPHGGNIRDFAFQLATELGVAETAFWETIIASRCMGIQDDWYPFTGGYQYY